MSDRDPDLERRYARTLRWYVPVLVLFCAATYTMFFPAGQLRWVLVARYVIAAAWVLASFAYVNAGIRLIAYRKRNRV